MAKFNPGDKVLINGTLVAEIDFYDDGELNTVRYITRTGGGTPNVITAPVSQTQIQFLVSEPAGSDEAPVVEPAIEEPVDPNADPNAEVQE